MNTIKFQTVANYIKAQAAKGQFSLDTAEKLRNGEIELRDNSEYIRKEVAAAPSGMVTILDATTIRKTGVSSFHSNTLQKSVNQVITHIKVGYANDAASGKEAAVAYATEDAMPSGLRNADLVIEQDGKPVVKLPISEFETIAGSTSNYKELSGFALLKEELPFSIKIDFPEGVNLGADKHYVEVSVKGMATFQR